jgi:AcrR family transcriptional regulator
MRPVGSNPAATHARLIHAATCVFVREGITRATTHEIAREARLNEITLFRHFQTKQALLRAVVCQCLEAGGLGTAASVSLRSTGNLQADLMHEGRRIQRVFTESLPLLRTFLAELHHYDPVGASQVLESAMRPWRRALIRRFQIATGTEASPRPASPAMIADLFLGMLFAGSVRQASPAFVVEYQPREYLAKAVELAVQACLTRRRHRGHYFPSLPTSL